MNTHPYPAVRQVVLVVDDDPAVRNSLKFLLELEGFAVRDYPGGNELLEDDNLPAGACLIIDQKMPGLSGLEVLAVLRSRHTSLPAILITAAPNVALRARAAAAGVKLIEKPLLGSALLDGVREVFSSH